MSTDKTASAGGRGSPPSTEDQAARLTTLRQQLRSLANRAADMDMESAEHRLVIDALKDVEPERRCFRMVGGVLMERTVGEVLPALELNYNQIVKLLENLNQKVAEKSQALNAYRAKHNISGLGGSGGQGDDTEPGTEGDKPTKPLGTSVLVSERDRCTAATKPLMTSNKQREFLLMASPQMLQNMSYPGHCGK
uniref:Prefoldin subunit 2 n=1 Tax=Eptatretus burgeri TaxID=7764 RepID=A0A8C4QIN6_EPTBU